MNQFNEPYMYSSLWSLSSFPIKEVKRKESNKYIFCAKCGKRAYLKCARCYDRIYCNRFCQELDWPQHKTYCNNIRYLNDFKKATLLKNEIDILSKQ